MSSISVLHNDWNHRNLKLHRDKSSLELTRRVGPHNSSRQCRVLCMCAPALIPSRNLQRPDRARTSQLGRPAGSNKPERAAKGRWQERGCRSRSIASQRYLGGLPRQQELRHGSTRWGTAGLGLSPKFLTTFHSPSFATYPLPNFFSKSLSRLRERYVVYMCGCLPLPYAAYTPCTFSRPQPDSVLVLRRRRRGSARMVRLWR